MKFLGSVKSFKNQYRGYILTVLFFFHPQVLLQYLSKKLDRLSQWKFYYWFCILRIGMVTKYSFTALVHNWPTSFASSARK